MLKELRPIEVSDVIFCGASVIGEQRLPLECTCDDPLAHMTFSGFKSRCAIPTGAHLIGEMSIWEDVFNS